MQIRPPDIADEQRIAREDQPRLGVPAARVGDDVGVVRRRMPGRPERTYARVSERDLRAVLEFLVVELDRGPRRQVCRRTRRFDQRRQPRDVVRLNVRLQHSNDRRSGPLRLIEIGIDERFVRIDHRELPLAQAAEEIRRARRVRVQKRTQDHARRLRRPATIALDEVADSCYR